MANRFEDKTRLGLREWRRDGGFVVVDLETTGLTPGRDEIIQVAACRVTPDGSSGWSSWVRPRTPVPPFITRLTGIDDERLASAPPWEAVRPELARWIGDLPLVGHNVGFDQAFLRQGGIVAPVAADTQTWARIAFPQRSSYRLSELADLVGWGGGGFHDARVDAWITTGLVEVLAARLASLPLGLQQWIERLMGREWLWWHVPPGDADRRHPLERPAPDTSGPPTEIRWERPVPEMEVVLGPGGLLARAHQGWQERPSQAAMARAVAAAFRDGSRLMAQAGTGVGKSLAYLVPALARAAAGERVVVATHTVALQDQLWVKDLPEAMTAMGLDELPVARLKGRSRYVCLLKAEDVLNEVGTLALGEEERVALASFLVWLQETTEGELEDWGAAGSAEASGVWDQVQAEVEACAGSRCRFAGSCFMRRSRRRAEESTLIVTNHALLLSAGAAGSLPEFRHLVIDEAHRLPDAADQVLGVTIPLVREAGRLADLAGPRGGWNKVSSVELVSRTQLAADRLKLAAGALAEAAEACRRFVLDHGTDETTLRLSDDVRGLWVEGPGDPVASAAEALETAGAGLEELLEAAGETLGPETVETSPTWLALRRLLHGCRGLAQVLRVFGDGDDAWVDWVELRGTRQEAVLRRAPLNPAELLAAQLWDQTPGGVVLTSATLSVGDDMSFMAQQLGLSPASTWGASWPSPFAAHRQALLAIPTDAPDPRDAGHAAFCLQAVATLALAAAGRTLVLTTSRRTMLELGAALGATLRGAGLQVLVQGADGPPQRLVDRLRREPRTVVVGTGSLWEGIDVAGPALSVVVVTRLPFAYPGDPLEGARTEWLSRRGVSPFWRRSLPQAVLRFQQGFGRLLRTETDRGAVVVLDPRVLPGRGRYGPWFLRALPGPALLTAPLEAVVASVTKFLEGEDAFIAHSCDE
jgi:Rad3-related DNA helicase/DNA polymerase III epsilon subunit-like protein